ncbi:MAG: [FeFe] hydrogenase, group A, partial [bacterium]
HPDFCAKGNCRVCVVEVKGKRKLVTACSTEIQNGMEISTDSPRVLAARKMNIELIFAEHIEKCPECVWRYQCKLLKFAKEYKLSISKFKDRKRARKIFKFSKSVELDSSQCIDCRNCVDACAMQKINHLEIKGKAAKQEIVPTTSRKTECILCGQCAVHCPVSAAQEQVEWQKLEKELKFGHKIMVAQFAPSLRVSIGEDFDVPYGSVMTGQMVAGLKKLGFDYVFDVNFGADITTMVEAEELLERVKNKGVLPLFTSCCPSWVNYVEIYRPDLIPNLTTARSPHMHSAGVIKTYWAHKKNISADKITVVSIMPCTSKKDEAKRGEMKIGGEFPVDHVLTTREFSFLLKKDNIDLTKLKPCEVDNPIGESSGAAVIYGGSGGVMESALRTAQYLACQESRANLCLEKLDFKSVRGMAGFKEAVVRIGNRTLVVGVVNGIGHIDEVLKNLKKYAYIEVMACPGGCIGGGGQPIPTTEVIRQKRIAALYQLDTKNKIRKAHENKSVKSALNWLKKQGHETEHVVLHTKYKKKI